MTFEEGINTITHSFMEMLNMAEELFGNRDKNWTFIGVEFSGCVPCIMYYPNNKISIVLSKDCSKEFPNCPQLYYQLAHEICHLLYPTEKSDATVLIEGISVFFSKKYQEKIYPESTYAIDDISKSKYYEAYQLVEKLLTIDKDAVKKIRQKGFEITNITESELKSMDFGLNDEEIKKIISKFNQ